MRSFPTRSPWFLESARPASGWPYSRQGRHRGSYRCLLASREWVALLRRSVWRSASSDRPDVPDARRPFLGLVDDLSQQHRAHVTAAYPARNSGKPCLIALRSEFGKIIAASKRPRIFVMAKRDSPGARDHLIDLGKRIPEGGEFCRSEDCKPGVRATQLEGACGSMAHDSVSEPIRRAQKKTKGMQRRPIGAGRKINPRFCLARRRLGHGVFQRLCTQNQSAGD